MTISLHPRWRQVVVDLLEDGLTDGKVIPKALLADLLGLVEPTTAEQQKVYGLRLLSATAEIRRELLERHSIHLRADGKGNLVVTPPESQTDVVMRDGQRDLQRTMSRMVDGVSHIRTESLSHDARRKNADAQAKLAALMSMQRTALTQN